jgi:hypothetical protein
MEDGVVEDMTLQGEFGEGEKEGFTPSGIEGGVGVRRTRTRAQMLVTATVWAWRLSSVAAS